jgi:hypothetical protein
MRRVLAILLVLGLFGSASAAAKGKKAKGDDFRDLAKGGKKAGKRARFSDLDESEFFKPVNRKSAEYRLARIWGKRHGLSTEQIDEQARAIREAGERAHGVMNEGHDVATAWDFKYRTLSIPKNSSRKAIVMRTNQPAPENLAELAAAAKEVGIEPKQVMVINLRAENNVEKAYHAAFASSKNEHERNAAEFRMLNLRILDHSIPSIAQVVEVLRAASDADTKLVVLHCKAGKARTGVMVAAIRIALDGWSIEDALSEAAERGMTRALQRKFIEQFAKDWKAGRITLGKEKA